MTSRLRQSSTSENKQSNLIQMTELQFPFLTSQLLPSLYASCSFLPPISSDCYASITSPPHVMSPSPSPRLTALEEELLDLARTLGSQQTSVEQLELELEAEREGVKKGQRWADHRLEPDSTILWCCIQRLQRRFQNKNMQRFGSCGDKSLKFASAGSPSHQESSVCSRLGNS